MFQNLCLEKHHRSYWSIWRRSDDLRENADLAVIVLAQVVMMMLADAKACQKHDQQNRKAGGFAPCFLICELF